jgi:hypothetical protein
MSSRNKVKLNSRGMKDLLTSRETRAMLTERAEQVLAEAVSSAPVVTGNYRDGLKIVQDTTDRAIVRVVGTAPHSHLVEAESGNLARALDAAG